MFDTTSDTLSWADSLCLQARFISPAYSQPTSFYGSLFSGCVISGHGAESGLDRSFSTQQQRQIYLHTEFHPTQPERPGLSQGFISSPLIMRNAIDGDYRTHSIGPAPAMNKHGPVLLRFYNRHYARDLIVSRATQSWQGNVKARDTYQTAMQFD